MSPGEKNALVFAATGAVGSAAARGLATTGTTVWLSARNHTRLTALAHTIQDQGGIAHVDVVDATDETEVARYLRRVAAQCRIDSALNAIGLHVTEGGWARPSSTVTRSAFQRTLDVIVWSQFLTTRAAAGHMADEATGSVILLSASVSTRPTPCMATISAASAAVEALTRGLAAEYRHDGVRVNCVRAGGMPATRMIRETTAHYAANVPSTGHRAPQTPEPPPRQLTAEDTAAVVAYLASDHSAGINGQVLTVDAGQALH